MSGEQVKKVVHSKIIVVALMAVLVMPLLVFAGMAENEGKTTDVNNSKQSFRYKDITVKYTEAGTGQTILLLHGFGLSSYTWRYLEAGLSKSAHVICFDLKGFGDSDKPEDHSYFAYDQAEILASFLKQQDLRDVTIAGNSFGGRVTMALFSLLSGTGRVKRLILIDSAGPGEELLFHVRLAKTPPIPSILSTLLPASTIARSLVASSFFDTTLIESDSLGVYANHLKLPGSMKAFARTASRVFVDDPREQIWADLSKVNIPVLILWGERDRVIPVANGHMLKEKIPDSRLIVFPLCGHMPQEEQPRETTAAILQFLEETP